MAIFRQLTSLACGVSGNGLECLQAAFFAVGTLTFRARRAAAIFFRVGAVIIGTMSTNKNATIAEKTTTANAASTKEFNHFP